MSPDPETTSIRSLRTGLLLTVLSLMLLVASLARAADAPCDLTVGSAVGRPGEVVEIPLTLLGSDVSALALVIEFDASRLVLDAGAPAGSKLDLGAPATVNATSWLLGDASRIGIVFFDAESPIGTLPEGILARLRFRIRPDAPGGGAAVRIVPAELSAADRRGGSVPATVAADGAVAVSAARPLLALSTSVVRFGSVAPGSSARQTVVALNAGSAPLRLTTAKVEGGAGAFSLTADVSRELQPGEGVPLELSFSATAEGEYRARLIVESEGAGAATADLTAAAARDEFFLDRRLLVPALARANGQNGSRWLSSLHLFNRGAGTVRLRGTLLRAAPLPALASEDIEIAPGATRSLDDAVEALFGDIDTSGALLIETSSDDLVVRSSTYNRAPDGSRLPQSVPAIDDIRLFRSGETASLAGLERSSARRTSVSVVNLGARLATLRLDLVDATGEVLRTIDVPVPARSVAYDVPLFEGVELDADASAVVRALTPDAVFFAYASTVEVATGAPLFQPAR